MNGVVGGQEGDSLWDPQGVCTGGGGRLQLVFCCNAREPEGLSLLGKEWSRSVGRLPGLLAHMAC